MGSDKKRKRRESEGGLESAERPDKAERKRLKRLKKEKERAEKEVGLASKEKKKKKKKDKEGSKRKGDEGGKEVVEMEVGDGGLDGVGEEEGEEMEPFVSPIATPMAGEELEKKLLKVIGDAWQEKAVQRGIKEVVWSIRKEHKGLCVLAGDVHPMDVIAHFPILCEDANIPYCYVSRKSILGAAAATRRPTCIVLVSTKLAKSTAVKNDIADLAREVNQLHNVI